jgi:hypothetical protein
MIPFDHRVDEADIMGTSPVFQTDSAAVKSVETLADTISGWR